MTGAEFAPPPWHLVFESLLATPDGSCLLVGWLDDRADQMTQIVAHASNGAAVDLRPGLRRYRRDDVSATRGVPPDRYAFGVWLAFGALPEAYLGARVAMTFRSGRTTEASIGATLTEPIDLRDRILDALAWAGGSPDTEAFGAGVSSLVRALHKQVLEAARIAETRFEPLAAGQPAISVVAALSGDPGMLVRQAALFAAAAPEARLELVFVHASPDLAAEFEALAETAHCLYGLRIALLAASRQIGSGRARNEAARLSAGQTLLFVGTAAAPGGGLQAVLARARSMADRAVVVGCRADADGAVGQMGMRFDADRSDRWWRARSGSPGLPASSAAGGDATIPVYAVAADPLLVRRRLFLEIGGFDESYFGSAWAVSDFCLRARGTGGSVVIDPALVFEELGGGADGSSSRQKSAALLDEGYFNDRWRHELENRARPAAGT